MSVLIAIFAFFWFVVLVKKLFFWVWLWQLKEYHFGRFIDHFRTAKGKAIFLNKLLALKILFLPALAFLWRAEIYPWPKYYLVFFLLTPFLIVYLIESLKAVSDFIRKRARRPVLTFKTVFLLFSGLLAGALFLAVLLSFSRDIFLILFCLSALDILAPVVFSSLVLFFQPLTVVLRNRIIARARKKREGFKDLLVVGITGSYGKTSTKEFLAAILSERYGVLKTKEHQNSEVGISRCILEDLKPEHQIFVCEMGAYNRGGIKLLCDIAKPKIGILTGINEQHMATFGSLENIIKAKYELIESLPKNGTAFFNARNKYCRELYLKTDIEKELYGERVGFPGEENILGAAAVARKLGMGDGEISRALERIKNRFPGIRIREGINGLRVVDATYSANPQGVMAHLEYVEKMPGKKIIVMPCLIELGKSSKKVHQRIGRKIGEVCDLAVITTRDRFREIREGAGEKAVFIENPGEITEKIKSFGRVGDIIILESRVPVRLKNNLLK